MSATISLLIMKSERTSQRDGDTLANCIHAGKGRVVKATLNPICLVQLRVIDIPEECNDERENVMYIGENCSGAIFSGDRRYRYALWRVWNREIPALIFVGVNPSYANEYKDDPTVQKLGYYANVHNYGGIYIANLFALVGTHSECLVYDKNAIGEENDARLLEMKRVPGMIIVGWGNRGRSIGRDKAVLDILGKPVYCFSVTKEGMPTHPLYLPLDSDLREYLPDPIYKG